MTRNVEGEQRLQSNATVFETVHGDDGPNSPLKNGIHSKSNNCKQLNGNVVQTNLLHVMIVRWLM